MPAGVSPFAAAVRARQQLEHRICVLDAGVLRSLLVSGRLSVMDNVSRWKPTLSHPVLHPAVGLGP